VSLPPPPEPAPSPALTAAEIEARLLEPADEPGGFRFELPFRTRVTVALVAAAILPLAGFGLLVVASSALGGGTADPTFGR
jgi:hypothetical protein